MKIQVTGEIQHIGAIEVIKYGANKEKEFEKRALLIADADDQYNDVVVFELGGKSLSLTDGCKEGQVVTVHGNVKCNENKNKPGNYFTKLQAWKIDAVAGASTDPAPATSGAEDDIPF